MKCHCFGGILLQELGAYIPEETAGSSLSLRLIVFERSGWTSAMFSSDASQTSGTVYSWTIVPQSLRQIPTE